MYRQPSTRLASITACQRDLLERCPSREMRSWVVPIAKCSVRSGIVDLCKVNKVRLRDGGQRAVVLPALRETKADLPRVLSRKKAARTVRRTLSYEIEDD
jgi:hypothetical protein